LYVLLSVCSSVVGVAHVNQITAAIYGQGGVLAGKFHSGSFAAIHCQEKDGHAMR